ncbi:TIGR04282 family arsenosugar biosynthesis glycosyltransferase [Halomonas elongata]|uniref:TIGR04282 family arsenosugar biosynthesis glycosyltransferase n=1 Tax=Halomonas elongata TaxID=2746 RepID=UPI0023AF6DB4|nr:TIGR04282 family arsenosugar biosynthesis glycosyltransferase [Halomonas elongata]
MSADIPLGDFPLAILAKAPIPGKAKTRLIPSLGARGAAEFHEDLVRHTLTVACGATPSHRITLWTALAPFHPLFLELAHEHDIALSPQPPGDLGIRIYQALSRLPGPGLLIGTDCPTLTPALLLRCYHALANADAVFLPAEDGGYGLVGVQSPDIRLFHDVPWGTSRVMGTTRERAAALGWRIACPATVWDIDRPEDLSRWASQCTERQPTHHEGKNIAFRKRP